MDTPQGQHEGVGEGGSGRTQLTWETPPPPLPRRVPRPFVVLGEIDLDIVPASVTPPRCWRKAAGFSLATSAAILLGLIAVAVAVVGPARMPERQRDQQGTPNLVVPEQGRPVVAPEAPVATPGQLAARRTALPAVPDRSVVAAREADDAPAPVTGAQEAIPVSAGGPPPAPASAQAGAVVAELGSGVPALLSVVADEPLRAWESTVRPVLRLGETTVRDPLLRAR